MLEIHKQTCTHKKHTGILDYLLNLNILNSQSRRLTVPASTELYRGLGIFTLFKHLPFTVQTSDETHAQNSIASTATIRAIVASAAGNVLLNVMF